MCFKKDNENSITNSSIKLNNLIWNHQKCEVEYRDCKEEELFQLTNNNSDILSNTSSTSITIANSTNNNNNNNNNNGIYKRQSSLTEVSWECFFNIEN